MLTFFFSWEKKDVDFLIDMREGPKDRLSELPSGIPELLKISLLKKYPHDFTQSANAFLFRSHVPSETANKDEQKDIAIDFTPRKLVSEGQALHQNLL